MRAHPSPSRAAGAPPPELVETQADLTALARELEREEAVAVDTEADSFFSYREKVCLVQISTEVRDFIVDPLVPLDLTPLERLLESERVRKVFHDAEYDVQLLKRAGFAEIRGVFDTRLGVALLGGKAPGLANVLRDRYGIELDKGEQRSDWRRRPLTPAQLEYARHDTRHLLRLARDVERDVRERQLWELFEFECRRVASSVPRPRTFDPRDCLTYPGARELDVEGLTALRELAIERENAARTLDTAPFRVLSNEALVVLARLRPRDRNELARIRALPPRARERFGRALLEALTRARSAPPFVPERRPEIPEEVADAEDRLRKWRTRKSRELSIDAACVLNRGALEELARRRPKTLDALAGVPGISPWHLRELGSEILAALSG